LGALKGRYNTAQGNALGKIEDENPAAGGKNENEHDFLEP